jgi:hypothetical protein
VWIRYHGIESPSSLIDLSLSGEFKQRMRKFTVTCLFLQDARKGRTALEIRLECGPRLRNQGKEFVLQFDVRMIL